MQQTETMTADDRERELEAAVIQARAHYVEMPGLTLTLAQAARLWALDACLCHEVLTTLVDTQFLIRIRGASFARA